MSEKIEPTQAMVLDPEFARALVAMNTLEALRAALNHPDARGLFSGEVVDALRAAREQGWDQAVDWIRGDQGGPSGRTTNARLANPYRPALTLPTEDGAVIVPADGREYIETQTGKKSRRLTWDAECLVWYDARGTHLHGDITPGTWKLDGEDSA